ncbi:guanine nucleotide-binding protein subunit alpha-15 isoform X2 [Lemur catta]|uniref:guanine nucleotide-binding protein subunit alpha-15 isoform X2 n=1 Tax=Lemur catta TaxID=9447 RepID=UPI001E269179|nr:guanine nucleotide-binding protein subunit alpha-15 isoform X2 [Lemur catta]
MARSLTWRCCPWCLSEDEKAAARVDQEINRILLEQKRQDRENQSPDRGRRGPEVRAQEVDPLLRECDRPHLPGLTKRVRPVSGGEQPGEPNAGEPGLVWHHPGTSVVQEHIRHPLPQQNRHPRRENPHLPPGYLLPQFPRSQAGRGGSQEVHPGDVHQDVRRLRRRPRGQQEGPALPSPLQPLHVRHRHAEHPQGLQGRAGLGARPLPGRDQPAVTQAPPGAGGTCGQVGGRGGGSEPQGPPAAAPSLPRLSPGQPPTPCQFSFPCLTQFTSFEREGAKRPFGMPGWRKRGRNEEIEDLGGWVSRRSPTPGSFTCWVGVWDPCG